MVNERVPVLYEQKDMCCGCTACFAVCPNRAIIMFEDEEGFEYPKIDEKKCVKCYMCISVCPIKKHISSEGGRDYRNPISSAFYWNVGISEYLAVGCKHSCTVPQTNRKCFKRYP